MLLSLLFRFVVKHPLVLLRTLSGSNFICTDFALTHIFDTHVSYGSNPYMEELSVQLANCVVLEKSNIIIAYLSSVTGRGIIGHVKINLMMVGCTHSRPTMSYRGKMMHGEALKLITCRDLQV